MTRALWLIVLLAAAACGAPPRPPLPRASPPDEAIRAVNEAEAQVRAGAYAAAARGFEDVVRRFPNAAVHDQALYGLARVFVAPENNARDYRQAYLYFDRLLREHPGSPYAPDARAWRGLLAAYLARTEEIERLKKLDLEMERRPPP